MYREAMSRADVGTLRHLRRLGNDWPPSWQSPGSLRLEHSYICTLPVLSWLVHEGCAVDWPWALELVERDWAVHPLVTAWLKERALPVLQAGAEAGARVCRR